MPTIEKYRVNYFVSGLLAQGGELWLDNTKIIFSPTSSIDRAFGARDVVIPFSEMQNVEYTGVLSRAFQIKTADKIHKFEGGQAKAFWDKLEQALPNKGLMSPLGAAPAMPKLVCEQCKKDLQPGYSHCPFCATRIKSSCQGCHRTVDPVWIACAFCGWKFANANRAAA